MCGIAGLISKTVGFARPGSARDDLDHMLTTMQHRGPDGRGAFVRGNVAMGMVRLAIVDPEGGDQPLWNEDRTVALVCNGEIYNAAALRSSLTQRGHEFRTQSDVEVIIHLFEEYGDHCFHMLEGIFAAAIWDKRRRSVYLVRDRVGVKPLYYADSGAQFAFASEVGALAGLPRASGAIDGQALDDYHAFRYALRERTVYRGIRRLLPGQYAVVRSDGLHLAAYWSPHCMPTKWSRRQAVRSRPDDLRALMYGAVESQLAHSVKSAVLLSGGLDSSALLAMRGNWIERGADTAITVVFDSPKNGADRVEYSELEQARRVARTLDCTHLTRTVGAHEALEALPAIVSALDEPIADPTAIPLWFAARLARQHDCKVVYSGEGLDELFAGYDIYGHAQWMSTLDLTPRALRARLRDWLARHNVRGAGVLERSLGDVASWYQGVGGVFTQSELQSLLQSPPSPHDISRRVQSVLKGRRTLTQLQQMTLFDIATWLPDNTLAKSDKIAMAHSVELRVPYLDNRIVDFALACPDEQKWNGRGKHVVRQALSGVVPGWVLRRRKAGFNIPISAWMFGEWNGYARDMLLGRAARTASLYDQKDIARLLQTPPAGQERAGRLLFTLLMFELWLRGNARASLPQSRARSAALVD